MIAERTTDQRRYDLRRRVRYLKVRCERQQRQITAMQSTYDLLWVELQQAERELAKAG